MLLKAQANSLCYSSRLKRIISSSCLKYSVSASAKPFLRPYRAINKYIQTRAISSTSEPIINKIKIDHYEALKDKTIIFVMGGPGSGKGTQCEMLSQELNAAFFSAGDLIRDFLKTESPQSLALQSIILEGRVIPSSVTVGLLCDSMRKTSKNVILVDGFPRNLENRKEFRAAAGRDCDLAVFFKCSEEEMRRRLLGRKVGRADDNETTIVKRVQGFSRDTLPVVELYESEAKLLTVSAERPPLEVFSDVRQYIYSSPLFRKQL